MLRIGAEVSRKTPCQLERIGCARCTLPARQRPTIVTGDLARHPGRISGLVPRGFISRRGICCNTRLLSRRRHPSSKGHPSQAIFIAVLGGLLTLIETCNPFAGPAITTRTPLWENCCGFALRTTWSPISRARTVNRARAQPIEQADNSRSSIIAAPMGAHRCDNAGCPRHEGKPLLRVGSETSRRRRGHCASPVEPLWRKDGLHSVDGRDPRTFCLQGLRLHNDLSTSIRSSQLPLGHHAHRYGRDDQKALIAG